MIIHHFFFFRWTTNGCQSFQFIEARFWTPTAYEITCRYGDRSSHNFPLLWTFAGSRAIAVVVEGRVEGEFHFSFFFFCGSDFLEILFWHNFSSFWGWDVDGLCSVDGVPRTGHDTKVTVTCGYVYNTSVYFFFCFVEIGMTFQGSLVWVQRFASCSFRKSPPVSST